MKVQIAGTDKTVEVHPAIMACGAAAWLLFMGTFGFSEHLSTIRPHTPDAAAGYVYFEKGAHTIFYATQREELLLTSGWTIAMVLLAGVGLGIFVRWIKEKGKVSGEPRP